MKWLVADWDNNKEHVFEDVIRALDALGHSSARISRSDMDHREDLVTAIRSGEFDALLTWQRFYPVQTDLLAAIKESGIRTIFMDYGFVPHYYSVVFDTSGENACSTWPAGWGRGGPVNLTQDDLDRAEQLMVEEAARKRLMAYSPLAGFDALRFPFVFIPFQRPEDSVVRYDSSVHDFGALLRRVLFLSRGSQFVVAKTHPLSVDVSLGVPDQVANSHIILRQPFGIDNEAACDYLLSQASLIVGINSNMLFRAVVFGTPVIATGKGWYSNSGAVREVDGLQQLDSLSVLPPDIDSQRRYIASCLAVQLRFEELGNPDRLSTVLERIGIMATAEKACA